jgi:hypothetical protein
MSDVCRKMVLSLSISMTKAICCARRVSTMPSPYSIG